MDNYEQLLERISKSAKLGKEEIEGKIEAKRAKLSGLISKEGAAQIVAAELGIVFDNEKLKVSEIVQGMKKVNVTGKIIQVFPVREFKKNGREGKVASFLLADDTSNIRVVLWDTNQISLIEKGEIGENSTVEIVNGAMRNGDLHLSAFSDIKISDEKFENVKTEKIFSESYIKDLKNGQSVSLRAAIVQIFEPRYFNDKKSGEKRALLNLVLDDGSETIRAVLFGETINKLGFSDEDVFSPEDFDGKKKDVLGEEYLFFGNAKTNQFFNRVEFVVNDVKKVDIELLIKDLESKLYN